jgi:thymidine phosphorylase
LLVASNVRVPKISASGSVAGGIDTLESIPGFSSELPRSEALQVLEACGIFHVLQTADLCPADRVLVDVRRERQMMANPYLATVSLLSKKLAVPGTRVLFDFRVGPEGNVGASFEEAEVAAKFMLRTAQALHLSVAMVLTDNRVSPTTAIGRLESLRLARDVLSGSVSFETDRRHAAVCAELAARAVALARAERFGEAHLEEIRATIESGTALRALDAHLAAQGAQMTLNEFVEKELADQMILTLEAESDGAWWPPPLASIKNFLKLVGSANRLVGYRYLIEPGTQVRAGDAVVELRGVASRTRLPRSLFGELNCRTGPEYEHPRSVEAP